MPARWSFRARTRRRPRNTSGSFRYFAGEEARVRYATLLDKMGRRDEAHALFTQVVKNLDGAPGRYRGQQKQWGDIAAKALKA